MHDAVGVVVRVRDRGLGVYRLVSANLGSGLHGDHELSGAMLDMVEQAAIRLGITVDPATWRARIEDEGGDIVVFAGPPPPALPAAATRVAQPLRWVVAAALAAMASLTVAAGFLAFAE